MSHSKSKTKSKTRVLVAPHNFEIGGSQINALELACAVSRNPDFEVVLYAPDGELSDRARRTGLELHLSSLREAAPSLLRLREFYQLVGQCGVDLVHAYEWAPTIDAAIGVAWARGVPVLSTILSMDYPYFLPRDVPTILGTREMWRAAQNEGRKAFLLEPPVDTSLFHPDAISPAEAAKIRAECMAEDGDILITVVGRLAQILKLDGLLALIQAVGNLSRDYPVKLAVVGDGPARGHAEEVAAQANRYANRQVVCMLGAKHDPLPYYAAADLVVGMGSSALRAMAVGKPLLVQGEKGFWRIADESSSQMFRSQGWYGIGDGEQSVERCASQLRELITASRARSDELRSFGRDLVQREYSLDVAAEHLMTIYRDVLSMPTISKGQGSVNIMKLAGEMAKYNTAIKMPWIRTASRHLTGRSL
ncbi:glycosyltransferase [Rhizobium sp. 2MFCol3.1]|uniref:glycosyltransferase n=1 Tax=Rhizobium sp. 2MFCol3.1 TaxID=1246459 RepID=UPI00037A1A94|nr:glycosyltransferase [Rhizobium sp. 2MFCol3.1]